MKFLTSRSASFQPILVVIEAETGKKVELEKAVNLFKTKLNAKIETKFLNNWKEMQLDASIAHLEFSKTQNIDDERKWRPTEESVEDQIRPAVVQELSKRKNILQRQMNYQNGVIEQLIFQVEQHRRQLRDQVEKGHQIIDRIDNDSVSMKLVEDKISIVHEVINSKPI